MPGGHRKGCFKLKRLFKKSEVLTVPNLLSLFRVMLLPVIVWLYGVKHDYPAAIAVLILSGLTDIVDGFIARKFNMVSDLGKILDPIADKLTQGVLLICLAVKYKIIILLVVVFALKEYIMITLGYIAMKRKDSVNSAKWYGKLNTVIIYSTIVLLIMFPRIPVSAVNALSLICIAVIVASFIMYARFYQRILKKD